MPGRARHGGTCQEQVREAADRASRMRGAQNDEISGYNRIGSLALKRRQ